MQLKKKPRGRPRRLKLQESRQRKKGPRGLQNKRRRMQLVRKLKPRREPILRKKPNKPKQKFSKS